MEEASGTIESGNIEPTLAVLQSMKAEWRKEYLELPQAWVVSLPSYFITLDVE